MYPSIRSCGTEMVALAQLPGPLLRTDIISMEYFDVYIVTDSLNL
jgi:hypothetical protein